MSLIKQCCLAVDCPSKILNLKKNAARTPTHAKKLSATQKRGEKNRLRRWAYTHMWTGVYTQIVVVRSCYMTARGMERLQTRMRLSLYPAKRVWPSADHANEMH